MTGAVTTVNVNDLKANPTANLSNALAGNVAGVFSYADIRSAWKKILRNSGFVVFLLSELITRL